MRTVKLGVAVTAEPGAALAAIADFERYPSLADDVREVRTDRSRTPRQSHWVMNFRRGLMRWQEVEEVDEAGLAIRFDQIDGDFQAFHGSWRVRQAAGGAEVVFEVSYDFGVDSLAGIMDPIAERVIKRAVRDVLSGLFVDSHVFEGAEALADLAGPVPIRASAPGGM